MRIVHLAPTGNWAGTETMVAQMANQSVASNEVAVLVKPGPNVTMAQIASRLDDRITLIEADDDASPGELAHLVTTDWHVPDVVHAHLRPGHDVAWHLRDLARVVGHLHVRYFSSQSWWVDAVACVSPWQCRDIPASFPGHVYLLENRIEPFPVIGPADIPATRASWRIPHDATLFGSIGRLSDEKGFDTLVRSFRLIDDSKARLVLIGDGPAMERLRVIRGTDDRVELVGYIPEARRLLPALDVFVSPSRLDSFGLSVLEAMAVNCPIVSTDARGPADLLDGQPATLVPVDDVDALAEALRRAAERVRAGETVVDYDLASYSIDTLAEELNDLYAHVTGTGTAPACLFSRQATQPVAQS